MASVDPSADPDSPAPGRLDSLTGMRFAAALLVFGFHITLMTVEDPTLRWVRRFFSAGPSAVSFFFILSGFLLSWIRSADDAAAAFYWRRVARIVPMHAVAWLAAVCILALQGRVPRPVAALLSMLLLQAWVPDPEVFFVVNEVLWSLSCEAFFYASFPWLFPRMARLDRRRRPTAIVALVTVSVGIAAVGELALEGSLRQWLPYMFPPTRLLEFLLGVLLALEVRDGRWPRVSLAPAAGIAVAAYLVAVRVPGLFRFAAVTLVPYLFLIGAAATADIHGRPSFFRRRLLVRLGQWSYAFYLLHTLVIRSAVSAGVRVSSPAGLLWFPTLLLAGILVSGAAYMTVERPAERWLRRRRLSYEIKR